MFLRNIFEALARTGEGKAAVVGWGRGMGHKGHMMLASSVITHANQLSADPYFVVSRTVGKDDPITPDEKLAIYKKVFPEQGHIFQTATDEIPDLTRVLSDLNRQGYTSATIVLGADQVKAFQYLKNYNGKADKAGNVPYTFDKLDVISRQETSDPSKDQEGPRATPMRAVLMDPSKSEQEQFQVWRDAMNQQVSDDEVRDLMTKAKERMQAMTKPKKKGVAEGHPAQQISRYNPDGATYRGSYNKMPTLDPNDPVHYADRYGPEHDEPYEMDFDKEELKRVIAKGMSDLSDNAKRVLELRFWDDLTYDEIASELGVSRERIRQIEAKALRQLKHPARSDKLRSFVQAAEGSKKKKKKTSRSLGRYFFPGYGYYGSGESGEGGGDGGGENVNRNLAEEPSNAMANAASRLANKDDGKVAKLRAAGDKRREDQLKGRDIAKRDTTSKDEWGNLKELSNDTLGRYKKAAGADATAADKAGDFKRADKRFSGIVKATKKQFANDAEGQTEEKQRLDPSCWKGYRKAGTKMKGSTRVNNCVKVSEGVEDIIDNLINKIIVNEAIQNNRK